MDSRTSANSVELWRTFPNEDGKTGIVPNTSARPLKAGCVYMRQVAKLYAYDQDMK